MIKMMVIFFVLSMTAIAATANANVIAEFESSNPATMSVWGCLIR